MIFAFESALELLFAESLDADDAVGANFTTEEELFVAVGFVDGEGDDEETVGFCLLMTIEFSFPASTAAVVDETPLVAASLFDFKIFEGDDCCCCCCCVTLVSADVAR